MTRLLLLATVLLGAAPALAADNGKVTIRWYGQSFFEVISSAGTRVVFDPHAIEEYGRTDVGADLVLLSHMHSDHTQVNALRDIAKATVIPGLKDPKGDGKRLEWNIVDQKFKDVHVRSIGAYHDNMEGMQRGKNTIFVVEMDGLRIVHLGDLGHTLDEKTIRAIGPVDVLMIPVGGVYTINGAEAKRVAKKLKPRQYILPMHYGTRVYQDLLTAEEFLDERDPNTVKTYQGNELKTDASFKPEEPIVVVLGWAPVREER